MTHLTDRSSSLSLDTERTGAFCACCILLRASVTISGCTTPSPARQVSRHAHATRPGSHGPRGAALRVTLKESTSPAAKAAEQTTVVHSRRADPSRSETHWSRTLVQSSDVHGDGRSVCQRVSCGVCVRRVKERSRAGLGAREVVGIWVDASLDSVRLNLDIIRHCAARVQRTVTGHGQACALPTLDGAEMT